MVMTESEDSDTAGRVEEMLRGDNVESAAELLAGMHPADQADLYDRLDDADRETMLALLSNENRALLLENLSEETLEEIVNLRELIVAVPQARIEDVMTRDVFSVRRYSDQVVAVRLPGLFRVLA